MYIATEEFAQHAPRAPERHREDTPEPALAWRVLDEIDYGLILVKPDGTVQHTNLLARHELARARFLRISASWIAGHTPALTDEIRRGVCAAAEGRRQMLTLRHGADSLAVACVPLSRPVKGESSLVLLMLARQSGTQNLAVIFFARAHGLTPAEQSVLRALCDGNDIQGIATAHGVCESTVRTQVRALRGKTNTHSIRLLVQQVAALPPVVPVSLAINVWAATQSKA